MTGHDPVSSPAAESQPLRYADSTPALAVRPARNPLIPLSFPTGENPLLCGDAVTDLVGPRGSRSIPLNLRRPLVLLVLAEDPHRSWRRRDVEFVLDLGAEAVRAELSALVEGGAVRIWPGAGSARRYQVIAQRGAELLRKADLDLEQLLVLAGRYAVVPHQRATIEAHPTASMPPLPTRTLLLLLLRHHPTSVPVLADWAGQTTDGIELKYLPRFHAAGWLQPRQRATVLMLSPAGNRVAENEEDRVGLYHFEDVLATVARTSSVPCEDPMTGRT